MSNFSDEVVDRIWRKGRTLDGWNSDEYRLDAAGAMMVKSHRGTDDNYDWEIDHVLPKDRMKELGIPEEDWDKEDNLRPFNAKNNNKKSTDYPTYTRALVFDEEKRRNVQSEIGKVVNEDVQRGINKCYRLKFKIVLGDHSLD